jgi:hypothetical protein
MTYETHITDSAVKVSEFLMVFMPACPDLTAVTRTPDLAPGPVYRIHLMEQIGYKSGIEKQWHEGGTCVAQLNTNNERITMTRFKTILSRALRSFSCLRLLRRARLHRLPLRPLYRPNEFPPNASRCAGFA